MILRNLEFSQAILQRYNNIQLQNMNMSTLRQSSIQFGTQIAENQKENRGKNVLKESKGLKRYLSNINAFKENIKSNQQQRNLKKLERLIGIKEDVIVELHQKYEKINAEFQIAKLINKQVKEENISLKEMFDQQQKKLESLTTAFNQERKSLKFELCTQEEKYKSIIKQSKEEVEKLKIKISLLTKQKILNTKRLSLQNQEIKRQFQGRLSVKEKQLFKVEETLKNRKIQNQMLLKQQEQQIYLLSNKVRQLQQAVQNISLELKQSQLNFDIVKMKQNQLELQYKKDIDLFSDQIDKLTKNYDYEVWVNKEINERIMKSLKTFQSQFQLKQFDLVDPCQIIQIFSIEISEKIEKEKKIDELTKLKNEIDNYRKTEVQLRNKINLLQQQLDFTKKNINNNENLASIIKQHLNKHDKKVCEEKATSKKSINFRSKSQSKIVEKINQSQNKISYTIENKLAKKQLNKQNKQSYDIIKNELTSKKKSLVQIMYGTKQQKSTNQSISNHFKKSTQNTQCFDRRRSFSMGEIVRQRCQRKIQQE